MTAIGAERYLVELIATRDVMTLAREAGWHSHHEEGLREFCEPEDAATYAVHASLDAATEAARAYLKNGAAFYGCVIIDHERFERLRPDMPPTWERQRSYEVAMDGERIEVER